MEALRRSLRYLYNGSTGGENIERHFMANDGSGGFRAEDRMHQDPRTNRGAGRATSQTSWTLLPARCRNHARVEADSQCIGLLTIRVEARMLDRN